MKRHILLAALFVWTGCPANDSDPPRMDMDPEAGDMTSDVTNPTDMPTPPDQGPVEDMETQDASKPLDMTEDVDPLPMPGPGRAAFCEARSEALRASTGRVIQVAPGSAGRVLVDGSERTLRQVVSSANDGDTIELADGTYTFDEAGDGEFTGIYITKPNLTLRSASGRADAVILDSGYVRHGNQSAVITIAAPGVTIADLSVQRSIFHLIHLWEAGDDATIHNVRLLDGGQQFLKSSGNDGAIEDAAITCNHFEMTDEGRDNVWGYGRLDGNTTCYTGGIDSHEGQGWWIANNHFQGIYCDATGVQRPAHGKAAGSRGDQTYQGGLSEHAIHLWDSVQGGGGHTIERNHIIDCARGIGLGFRVEVHDVIVRHNFISTVHEGSREHDVGISLERAQNSQVYHNTVVSTHPEAYPHSIEYRYEVTSGLTVFNNLTTGNVRSRNNAPADASHNVRVSPDVFVDAEKGDLHLSTCDVAEVVGSGRAIPADADADARMDHDHDVRGASLDIGADQCSQP